MAATGRGQRSLHVSLTSGLCNRLWVLVSAVRVAALTGRSLAGYWYGRTGRTGLPYVGTTDSALEDFFRPLDPAVAGVPCTVVPVVRIEFPDSLPGVNLAGSNPRNLPRDADGRTTMAARGPAYERMRAPHAIDDRATLEAPHVLAHYLTHPLGTGADPMAAHRHYPATVGRHTKDAYLEDLGALARRLLVPHPATQAAIAAQLNAILALAPSVVVGVHARCTDMAQRSGVDRRTALSTIVGAELGADPGAVVYFASDDPALTASLAAEFAGERFCHYNDPVAIENSVAGTSGALVDLYTLAACGRLYGTAGSSFSAFAWLLSRAPILTVHS